jgi:hypothetical protein
MVTEAYPSVPLKTFQGRPIGKANFEEPVFKRGVFQDRYITVVVTVYSGKMVHPTTNQQLIPVQFGEMSVIRFVEKTLLTIISDKK